MEHNNNNSLFGFACGAFGGLTKYFFLQINEAPYMMKLLEAGITALICGALGAIGKYLVDKYIIKKHK
jgi:hypothetical protein